MEGILYVTIFYSFFLTPHRFSFYKAQIMPGQNSTRSTRQRLEYGAASLVIGTPVPCFRNSDSAEGVSSVGNQPESPEIHPKTAMARFLQ
jgi:hypothetical protein